MSNGNGTSEKIIIEIKAEFKKVFTKVPQLALTWNELRLQYQGVRTFTISPVNADSV